MAEQTQAARAPGSEMLAKADAEDVARRAAALLVEVYLRVIADCDADSGKVSAYQLTDAVKDGAIEKGSCGQ